MYIVYLQNRGGYTIYETITTTWFSADMSNEISFALPSSTFENWHRIAKNTYFFVILQNAVERKVQLVISYNSTSFFSSNYEDKFLILSSRV